MSLWNPTAKCEDCGAAVPLRTFRSPSRWCPNCAPLHADEGRRETYGCLVCFPLLLVAAYSCGLIAYRVGQIIAPLIPLVELPVLLAFVAAVDGAGAVMVHYTKHFTNELDDQNPFVVRAVYLMAFGAIGMRCALGHGIYLVLLAGLMNTLVMLPVVIILLPSSRSTE